MIDAEAIDQKFGEFNKILLMIIGGSLLFLSLTTNQPQTGSSTPQFSKKTQTGCVVDVVQEEDSWEAIAFRNNIDLNELYALNESYNPSSFKFKGAATTGDEVCVGALNET